MLTLKVCAFPLLGGKHAKVCDFFYFHNFPELACNLLDWFNLTNTAAFKMF